MLSKDKITRINELANKSKKQGLNEKEKEEQKDLREQYLKNARKSFANQMKGMTVIDPNGDDVTPKKLKKLQQKREN